MGITQSVDFGNFQNQEQLRKYMEELNKTISDISNENEELRKEINKRIGTGKISNIAMDYFEVEQACSLPRFMRAIFPSQRIKCNQARLKLIDNIVQSINDAYNAKVLHGVQISNQGNINYLTNLVKTNQKYLKKDL